MAPKFFASAGDFRRWLGQNHATERELLIGFHKKASGRGGLTYPEALDEALCFGWIDGVRKSAGDEAYTIRFTPRRAGSIWSLVNIRHVERLTEAGRMHAAGTKAFAARDPKKTGVYSFEKRPEVFPAELERQFRANKRAWEFWGQQPPGYRRLMISWVTSAKTAPTRDGRMEIVLRNSAAGRRVNLLAPRRER